MSLPLGARKTLSASTSEPTHAAELKRPAREAPSQPQVLILHNSPPGPARPGVVDGNNIIDLLPHFGLGGRLEHMEDYRPGELSTYHFVIVLGDDDRMTPFPEDVLEDIRRATVPVLWVRRHIHELLADPKFVAKVGFSLGPLLLRGFSRVEYKGKILTKGEPFLFPIIVKAPAKVTVVATALSETGEARPYIVRADNFWYIGDSPFAFAQEGDRYWAFADLLHDFFGVSHPETHEALLRIEDVSVEFDPQLLIDIANFLYHRDIPFQVGLIPIFKRPEDGTEIHLADRPEFVKAIRYMMSHGGTVVLHGSTHQYRGKTADDYEFWDGLNGRPVRNDSRAYVEPRLHQAVEETLHAGIYPVAWETPHYMASQLDYGVIASHFSCAYESVPSVDREDTAHQFPYPSIDRFGRQIIPESLGYIDLEKPDVDALLENADRLQVVRDGVASFFFHPFLDRAYLKRIIDGIESLGYEFTSVRDFNCRITFDDMVVQTYEAPVTLNLEDRYLHRFLVNRAGEVSDETYSEKPVTGRVSDPGLVRDGTMLVMEGVFTNHTEKPAEPPRLMTRLRDWWHAKLEHPKSDSLAVVAQPKAVVLWDDRATRAEWNDQASFASALGAYGFRVAKPSRQEALSGSLERDTVLVVPQGSAAHLSRSQLSAIVFFVRDGGHLVLDGPSPLARALGVKPAGRKPHLVRALDDLVFGTDPMVWNPPVELVRFSTPTPVTTYVVDRDGGQPVAVLCGLGEGRFLYLAALFDTLTPFGYTHYPYLVHYLLQGFGLRLPLERMKLELYFDPGLANRQGIDIGRLAMEWKKLGVRAVYAAAWHFWPGWSYDYAAFVDACHKNGILAYAWLELPHVSEKFWEDHPECRAKTATGEDGKVGWRSHIDLDLPPCQDLAFGFVEDFLRAEPWDGVNIAELSFESDGGPENPHKYLPMGASTRQAFQALGGFDPMLLFDPKSPHYWKMSPASLRRFESYRSERVEAWHRALLRRLVPLAKERDMEIIVTMFDSLHSPTVRRDTGVDSHSIVALMDEFPFTLQVEDPASFWADPPDRYSKFTDTYLRLVKDRRRLMFDLNVIPTRNIARSHSPIARLSGTELAQSLLFAGRASGRVGIYSEGTLAYEDLQLLSRVLAHDATLERQGGGWRVDASSSLALMAPGQWQSFRVDDVVWPGWSDRWVLIPPGSHRIGTPQRRSRLVDTSALDFRLSRFTGDIERLAPVEHGLTITYDSPSRAMAVFNREPSQIRVDGQVLAEPPLSFLNDWSVRLPSGRHTVEVAADSAATVILQTASVYSSSLIVIFGSIATGLMVLLYMAILIRRVFTGAVRKPPTAPSGPSL